MGKRVVQPLDYINKKMYYLVSYKTPKMIRVFKIHLTKHDIKPIKDLIKEHYPKTYQSMDIVKGGILLKYLDYLYISIVKNKITKYKYEPYQDRKKRKLIREKERRARKPKKPLKYKYPKDCVTKAQKHAFRKLRQPYYLSTLKKKKK